MAPIGIISGGSGSLGLITFNSQRLALAAAKGATNMPYRPKVPQTITTVKDVEKREAEATQLALAKKREPTLLRSSSKPAQPLSTAKPSTRELPSEIQGLLYKHFKTYGAGLNEEEFKTLEDFREASAWNRRLCAMATARITRESHHQDSLKRQTSRFKAIVKRSQPRRYLVQ